MNRFQIITTLNDIYRGKKIVFSAIDSRFVQLVDVGTDAGSSHTRSFPFAVEFCSRMWNQSGDRPHNRTELFSFVFRLHWRLCGKWRQLYEIKRRIDTRWRWLVPWKSVLFRWSICWPGEFYIIFIKIFKRSFSMFNQGLDGCFPTAYKVDNIHKIYLDSVQHSQDLSWFSSTFTRFILIQFNIHKIYLDSVV